MSAPVSHRIVEEEVDAGHSSWNSPSEILSQLERLVSSVHFRNSKRYPTFLRYIVEQTLQGRMDCLKERTLGIEVFRKPADYDTNLDPVVRITAGEVRKRIAQYYQSPEHEHELRIDLPLGSYVPHFLPAHGLAHASFFQPEVSIAVLEVTDPGGPGTVYETRDLPTSVPSGDGVGCASAVPAPEQFGLLNRIDFRSRHVRYLLAAIVFSVFVGFTLAAVGSFNSRKQEAGLSFFWGPFLSSREPTMIVLGVHSFDTNGNDLSPMSYARLPLGQQTALSSMIRSDMVPVSDVVSYSELISLLTRRSLPFHTQSAAETTLEEFRHGPLILIGGFDNMWTMRLTASLRFRFLADSESVHEIQDTENPTSHWRFDNAQSALSNSRDYAIVARFFDPQIEQHVLVVAGIGKSGTEAAAEFVTNKRTLQSWIEASPAAHRDNVEIVLSTDIIEGKHGPPHVVATYRW